VSSTYWSNGKTESPGFNGCSNHPYVPNFKL